MRNTALFDEQLVSTRSQLTDVDPDSLQTLRLSFGGSSSQLNVEVATFN